jgi:hypothetical protein
MQFQRMDRYNLAGSLSGAVPAGLRALVLGFVLAGGSFSAASAGTCIEQVRSMANEYGIAVDPPNAPKSGVENGVTSKELKKSGGVIEPPQVNDPAVIEPPGGVRYGMPTMPDVGDKSPKAEKHSSLDPQQTALLESILVAARSEALRGSEEDCYKQVRKAQDFVGN